MMSPRNLPSAIALAVVVATAGATASAVPAVADTTPTSTSATTAATNPTPPVVTSGGVESLSRTGATLTGAVTPGAADTTYHFQYGTSTAYGLNTPDVSLPASTSATAAKQAITGLTVGTSYHYRLVATNAAGTTNGSDKSFTTQANPKAPSVSALGAAGVQPTGATLQARVNPNGQDTTVTFQYGLTTKYGSTTAPAPIGSGTATVTPSVPVTGLLGNTKYHFRVIAQNGTGKATGSDRTFTTPRGLTGVGMAIAPNPVTWGQPVIVNGTVGGAGVGGVGVKLLQQDFPFTGTFAQIATQTSSSAGAYSFTIPKATAAVKLQVVTTTGTVPVTSPVSTLHVNLYTALSITKKSRKSYTTTGTIYPAVSAARVRVQRKSPKGSWVTLKRVGVKALDTTGSTFKTTLPRVSRKSTYRMIVTPHDGGAHLTTTSSTVSVAKKR